MTAPNRATLWAQVFVDELARAGLRAVCLAPGSRSTPLTLAFAGHPDIEVFSHLDERSASFFALGHAQVTRRPAAVVCTSGTAAANFYPAIIEAAQAHVPLLVLTADRSHERSTITITEQDGNAILTITATDVTAFRATLNGLTGALGIYEKTHGN